VIPLAMMNPKKAMLLAHPMTRRDSLFMNISIRSRLFYTPLY